MLLVAGCESPSQNVTASTYPEAANEVKKNRAPYLENKSIWLWAEDAEQQETAERLKPQTGLRARKGSCRCAQHWMQCESLRDRGFKVSVK